MWRALRLLTASALLSSAMSGSLGAEPGSDSFRILLTGDVSFGENYQADAARRGRPDLLAERGYDYPLARLEPILRRADYTIVNLETPLTGLERSPLADAGKDYYHWGHIDKTPGRLVAYGVDAVGLANNHMLDFGVPGLKDTFRSLKRYGIASFGAGEDAADAAEPLVRLFRVGRREVSIGLIARFERRKSYELFGFYAGARTPGVNPLDPQALPAQVAGMRRRNPGIFVISYVHWGSNYAWRTPEQQRHARALIDAGVDMVVGHHGHMLQEIERYRDKWIIYGLGNFMFNSAGRFASFPEAVPYGLAMELVLQDRAGSALHEVRLYPIMSDNLKVDYQPRIAKGHDADRAFGALLRRSALGADQRLASRGSDKVGPFLRLSSVAAQSGGAAR